MKSTLTNFASSNANGIGYDRDVGANYDARNRSAIVSNDGIMFVFNDYDGLAQHPTVAACRNFPTFTYLTASDQFSSEITREKAIRMADNPINHRDAMGLSAIGDPPDWSMSIPKYGSSGASGGGDPDPYYDEKMMTETFNRALDNGKTGNSAGNKYWYDQSQLWKTQYERNKGGGGGMWLSDYYPDRVTSPEVTALTAPIAQLAAERRIDARTLSSVTAKAKAVGLDIAILGVIGAVGFEGAKTVHEPHIAIGGGIVLLISGCVDIVHLSHLLHEIAEIKAKAATAKLIYANPTIIVP